MFTLRRPRVAFYADIIKNIMIFIKTIFKNLKKKRKKRKEFMYKIIKRKKIMYQNAIYICI